MSLKVSAQEQMNIEGRMIRYRYGPWDPAYYAILGRLIGRGLIKPVPTANGIGYRATETGTSVATALATDENWSEIAKRAKLLRNHFDLTGNGLKDFIYEHFPEVAGASWGERL
jgi:hypothetical protein